MYAGKYLSYKIFTQKRMGYGMMGKICRKRKNIMHQTKGTKGENQYGDAKSDKGICGTI